MEFALLTTSNHFTPALLETVAAAYRLRGPQLAAAWTPLYPDAVSLNVRCVSSVQELKDTDIPLVGTVTLDDPRDLAYHFIRDGHPYGLILCDGYQTIASMVRAWMHELLETQLDPLCNLYANGLALECKDTCQNDSDLLTLPDGTYVDDGPFATPAWFGLSAGPTLSNGLPLAPGAVRPTGYFVRQDGSQVLGMHYSHAPHKYSPHSRMMRRAWRLHT